MCGIAASIGRHDRDGIADMLLRIRHRGPDDMGICAAGENTFGHVRLSIIDAEGGHQPMWNPDRSVCLTYNGEVYNYEQLRETRCAGRRFVTRSDTEVLLALIESCGSEAPALLDGMFAFVALRDDEVIAARDPIGIKPLYFSRRPDGSLLLASERKAFPPNCRVEEFPPGHVFSSRRGVRRFHAVDTHATLEGDVDAIIAGIRVRLEEAVRKRLVSDVPIGVFLSGGLDSSIIAALMRPHLASLHSFSTGMLGAPDLAAARAVARHLGTIHHEIVYTVDNMQQALPDVIRHLESFDQPLVRSAIPNWFLARLASDHVKVVLTGEGADELFAGYRRYETHTTDAALRQALTDNVEHLHNTNLQRTDRMTMAFSIEARVPFLDADFVAHAQRIPVHLKRSHMGMQEKHLLRRAFADLLPTQIAVRAKQKFSEGTGSGDMFAQVAHEQISDLMFEATRNDEQIGIRSKEELLYYRIFASQYGAPLAAHDVGRTPACDVL